MKVSDTDLIIGLLADFEEVIRRNYYRYHHEATGRITGTIYDVVAKKIEAITDDLIHDKWSYDGAYTDMCKSRDLKRRDKDNE